MSRNVARYRRQIGVLAGIGYLVVAAVLVLGAALVGLGLVTLVEVATELAPAGSTSTSAATLLGTIYLGLGLAVLHALWLSPRNKAGLFLKQAHAAPLFAEVDALCKRVGAPRVHEIRLGEEFNASILRIPRLGVLGWHSNVLVIGMPMLLALDGAGARAVIAHELAHIARRRGGFNTWAFRLRHRWRNVHDGLRGSTLPTRFALAKFFYWYSLRYSRLTLPLSREQEFFADALAAEATSVVDTASALTLSYAYSRCANFEYWAPLLGRIGQREHPPQRSWSDLAAFLVETSHNRPRMLNHVQWVLSDHGRPTDSHPSLTDRLASLGAPEMLPRPLRRSAAEAWFGTHLAYLLQRFDTHWWLEHEKRWRGAYERAQRGKGFKRRRTDTPA